MSRYTTVTIATADLLDGRVPPVCVRTGEPATRYDTVPFRNRRTRSWATIPLVGWASAAVLRIGARRRQTCRLPVSDQTHTRRTCFNVISSSARWSTALLGFYGAAADRLLPIGVFGSLVLAAVNYPLARRIFCRADLNRDWVTLRGVHPEFAIACSLMTAERMRADPPVDRAA